MGAKTTSPERSEDRSTYINQPGEPAEQVQLSLTDLTARFEPLSITVGDVFASEKNLVYLPLRSTLYTGNLAGIGFLTGGIAGGIAANVSNAQNLGYARDMAKADRRTDFGVSLEERVQKHKGLVIPKLSIESIEIINQEHAIRVTHSGGQLDLGSDNAGEYCRQLKAWRLGTLAGELNTQGANLGIPPAATLLLWFIDGSLSAKLPGQALNDISSEPEYLKGLFFGFDLKNYPTKVAVINTVRRLPEKWTTLFREHMQVVRAKAQRNLRWAAAAFALGILAIAYNFLPSVAGQAVGILLIGAFLFMLSIPVLLVNSSNNNKLKKLISLLGTK